MFEVGFSEILMIGIVALLVLGPEKLPGAARTVGGIVRRLRSQWLSLQTELERELQTDSLRRDFNKELHDTLGPNPLDEIQLKQQLDETFAELRQAVKINAADRTSISEGLSVTPRSIAHGEMHAEYQSSTSGDCASGDLAAADSITNNHEPLCQQNHSSVDTQVELETEPHERGVDIDNCSADRKIQFKTESNP